MGAGHPGKAPLWGAEKGPSCWQWSRTVVMKKGDEKTRAKEKETQETKNKQTKIKNKNKNQKHAGKEK